jgi:hypothetical protein
MRERDIERYLVKRVNELGGEVRKVKWVGRAHAPDRVVMMPKVFHPAWNGEIKPGAVCLSHGRETPAQTTWVELKAPGEKPRPGQLREHERMRRMGQRVEVIDSIEGVEKLLA